MNKIINYLLAIRAALINGAALSSYDLVDEEWSLNLNRNYHYSGGDYKNPCGWNITEFSIDISRYRDELATLSVSRHWVEFQMPEFFKAFIKIAFNCGLLKKGEDPILWDIFREPYSSVRVQLDEPKTQCSVWFNPRTGVKTPLGEYRKIMLEIPYEDMPDDMKKVFEKAVNTAFEMLDSDLKNVLGKVVMLFEQFHKEKFMKHYAMKPYYALEEAFMRDLIAGRRLWGQKADKMAADMSEIVKIPHFLAIGDIYSGSFDLMRVESTSSWD
jgi:hypothetical protein